jgi:hypothetical protein
MVIVLQTRDCLVYRWLYCGSYINMTKKMTMQEAIQRVLQAVEYYDMVHDTGDAKRTKENKDYAWKGYNRLVEICHED